MGKDNSIPSITLANDVSNFNQKIQKLFLGFEEQGSLRYTERLLQQKQTSLEVMLRILIAFEEKPFRLVNGKFITNHEFSFKNLGEFINLTDKSSSIKEKMDAYIVSILEELNTYTALQFYLKSSSTSIDNIYDCDIDIR